MQNNKRWCAKWIWREETKNENNIFCYFRKIFSANSLHKNCKLFISADTRYELYLNGEFIGRGVPQSQPFYQYYDEYNLAANKFKEKNCIAVVVYHLGTLPDTRGGLLLEIENAAGETIEKTDDSWRVIKSPSRQQDTYYYRGNQVTPFQEIFDMRLEPVGWKELSFDENEEWRRATIIRGLIHNHPPCSGPWSKLIPRDIPFMKSESVFAKKIEKTDENLQLINRSRPNDLSPGLSMVGKPIKYSKIDSPEALLKEDGDTIIQSSLNHKNLDFDGIYSPAIVLDFGKIITARAKILFAGVDGAMISVGYAERLIDGNFNISMECEFADRCIMKNGEQTFESFSWKSFRYLKLKFHSCFNPVKIHSVQAVISTYPFEEKGVFQSDDEMLNSVFEISRYTIQLCSNEFLMDTPWREQAQWLGDVALVTIPAIYSCFGDEKLARKFYMQAGQNQHPTGFISNVSNTVNHDWMHAIPDYSLWYVQGLWEHYLYTGDAELLNRLYPQVLKILYAHLEYINENGLLENMPYWVFIDWANVERSGVCTAYNAIFFSTLKSWRKIAEFKNDNYTIELCDSLTEKMKASFHKNLFDENRGCFSDANINGELSKKISEHGNMTPIFAGLCDEKTSQKIINKIFKEPNDLSFTEAQPFYMAVVLRALAQTNNFSLAIELINNRWGKRMVEKGATSTYEEWYRNGSWRNGDFSGFLRSSSHAWSAFPADFLIRYLIGLEIEKPGCEKIKLNPKLTTFDYKVIFPTRKGNVTVENKNKKINVFAENVDLVY